MVLDLFLTHSNVFIVPFNANNATLLETVSNSTKTLLKQNVKGIANYALMKIVLNVNKISS